jgi:hypothetical protein
MQGVQPIVMCISGVSFVNVFCSGLEAIYLEGTVPTVQLWL